MLVFQRFQGIKDLSRSSYSIKWKERGTTEIAGPTLRKDTAQIKKNGLKIKTKEGLKACFESFLQNGLGKILIVAVYRNASVLFFTIPVAFLVSHKEKKIQFIFFNAALYKS